MPSERILRWLLKPSIFLLSLAPLFWLAWRGFYGDGLGANPIEEVTHSTGDWTLRFLLITLLVSPLRRLLHQNWLIRLRRMLGLYAFFYACLHFATYLWLDQFFDWREIAKDIIERPFINVGFIAFVLLIPLAATSATALMRRLGRNWATLHRLVYVSAVLGVLHFWWLVKADIREPAFYALLLGVLLGARLYWAAAWRLRTR